MSVIIVGGGMVGATLALAISRLSQGMLPVHLIEATAPEADSHPGFDARAPANNWHALASGRQLPTAPPRSIPSTSAIGVMPVL